MPSQMRIILDARMLDTPQPRGIGRSLLCLYDEISRRRPDWQIVLVHRGISGRNLAQGWPNARQHCVQCAGDRWDFWGRMRLPLEAWRLGGHVLHAPANTGPELSAIPLVMTVHDTIPIERGLAGALPDRRWMRHVQRAAMRARRILTPSRHSRDQLVRNLAIDGDKIVVCPWAADPNLQRITDPSQLADVRQRYDVSADRPCVFAFGAADPRKNTPRLIEAWAAIDPSRRRDWLLLLVGIQPAALPDLQRRLEQLGLQNSVLLRGFVAAGDIAALISSAQVLAYPSLSEGFGLPLLEGFVCGTAVLSGNQTSLPEVAGDAALLVDPTDTSAIAAGLGQLLADQKLRTDLAARGLRRAADFTWSACADITCDTLEEAGA